MTDLSTVLKQNAEWASGMLARDPEYFTRLSAGQAPELLWIGCSDSRVPVSLITGLGAGEVFVHRNIANVAYPTDLNGMSVLQYAVDALRVRHIIVCGHYGCGGVNAALTGAPEGPIDQWLEPIRQLARQNSSHLATLADDKERTNFLVEENVRAQVRNIAGSPVLRRARERGQEVFVHGWIYALSDGRLRELECNTADIPR